MNALTIAGPEWTQERIDLVKRTVCPKGITNDEFALFMEQCRRTGLDPLTKEIFCVPRRKNIGNKDTPNWITIHEAQPSEGGMLGRADKFPDFIGITAAAVYGADKVTIDAGEQKVAHTFSPTGNRGQLLGAWARVEREGREPILVWLEVGGYRQNTPTWNAIPATMIEKCARVAALRKAYPGPFGNSYVDGEMREEHEDDVVEAPKTVAPPPPAVAAPKAKALKEPAAQQVIEPAREAEKVAAPAEVVTFTKPAEMDVDKDTPEGAAILLEKAMLATIETKNLTALMKLAADVRALPMDLQERVLATYNECKKQIRTASMSAGGAQ